MGVEVPVLGRGFVQLVDYMGTEESITRAARVSYAGGTKQVREDRGLIRYLMRHRHTTPFEMCEVTLHVKLPIFVARQWIRHRTASVNEVSARYSVLDAEYYSPDLDRIAEQSTTNKQGSGKPLTASRAARMRSKIEDASDVGFKAYEWLNGNGVAREIARLPMPLNAYTRWFWKIDVHNLMHFLALRCDPHAQYEIRAYAEQILLLLADWMPNVYEAFRDYRMTAGTFSGQEVGALRAMVESYLRGRASCEEEARVRMKDLAEAHGLGSARERKAFWSKLGAFDVLDGMASRLDLNDESVEDEADDFMDCVP